MKMQEDAEKKAAKTVADAETKAANIEEDGKRKADSYWELVYERLEHFYDEHRGLRELLQLKDRKLNR